ncbi:MAG: tRNA-splicing ligase RtcB [Dehalococcoidia bacterium]|nr:tRNA-splicing ligase RtcB [Dehalococcoidia bacterium]
MSPRWEGKLRRIDDYRWEIPRSYKAGMRVPGIVYASEEMLETIREEQAMEQVVNVAFLPGIECCSLAMPDIHWGYGFPIGGVAATRVKDGVVSPGGVGFDINCGVRMLRTNLTADEVKPRMEELVNALFYAIPSGVGAEGKLRVSEKELDQVLVKGARWAVEKGLGLAEDLAVCEEEGAMKGADPGKVSARAKARGKPQLGTVGSGNHFAEVQEVVEIFEPDMAKVMGIQHVGQVTVMVHSGSRGLGHQVCTDYLEVMGRAISRYGISLPDRQLACAPVESPEGQDYLAAMAAAANYAWTNRHCMAHWVRETFARVLGRSEVSLGMRVIYDVAHNIAKMEKHVIDGERVSLCVHRKGATRAFPPGHPDIPDVYKKIGQPVLIPGDMGRYSFLAVGTERALKDTWGSTCHGAGRRLSRGAAKRSLKGVNIAQRLRDKGILVRATSMGELAEEASEAYKDVAQVVEVTHQAGISRNVARMRPLGVVKG